MRVACGAFGASVVTLPCRASQPARYPRRYICHHWPDDALRLTHIAAGHWGFNADAFQAWASGRTGYPLVDAAMRCLLSVGWLSEPLHELAAAFLVKALGLPWQWGLMHVWERLVGAEVATCLVTWAAAAGCLRDGTPLAEPLDVAAASRRIDPDAAFLRAWVPELAGLPSELAFEPWDAPPEALAAAGVVLGHTYPGRVVTAAEAAEAHRRVVVAVTRALQGSRGTRASNESSAETPGSSRDLGEVRRRWGGVRDVTQWQPPGLVECAAPRYWLLDLLCPLFHSCSPRSTPPRPRRPDGRSVPRG